MKSNQKSSIGIVSIDPVQPDCHPSKINDFTDLFGSFFIIFGLLTGIIKLWRSIDKLRKNRKCSPKLLLSIISALWAIVKAILQMNDEDEDEDRIL
jgi:hypothetical protein